MTRRKLFVFEMANNHMGDVEHGLRLIREFGAVKDKFPEFDFALKFQFRNMDTFIHPDYRDRMDLKYVKRFSETRLSRTQFLKLKLEAENLGFIPMCTGFDEDSVDRIEEMGFPIIKIASCSFTDWPLLNKIAATDLPIIASTAGSTLKEIDNVVAFFTNREKDLTIMHCVGEYPTKTTNLQLNQLRLFSERYPNVRVGYSTHEDPNDPNIVPLAIAMGAEVFEKHVGVPTEQYALNAYSATPEQAQRWLESARRAFATCGDVRGRPGASKSELADLRRFKRGVFVARDITAGERVTREDVFYAFPCGEGQVLANDMSKYTEFVATTDYKTNDAVMFETTRETKLRQKVWDIVQDVKSLFKDGNVVIPGKAELEISHHYGIDKFREFGITMVTVVNREYCKKLIAVLPKQYHPEQYHLQKEETFLILFGELELTLDGETTILKTGDVVTVKPEVRHAFTTTTGAIIEEISSTHIVNDSFYTDETIIDNKNRKTILQHWLN
jgi:sialic acid synthase SpsE